MNPLDDLRECKCDSRLKYVGWDYGEWVYECDKCGILSYLPYIEDDDI